MSSGAEWPIMVRAPGRFDIFKTGSWSTIEFRPISFQWGSIVSGTTGLAVPAIGGNKDAINKMQVRPTTKQGYGWN